MRNVVVVSAKRTPFGKFGGTLMDISNVELGALAVKQAMGNLIAPEELDQVIMGHVMAGSGFSPIRQIVLAAGWPKDTNTMAVERACCTSMTAIGMAYERIKFGRANIIMAGGTENMSKTPYMLPNLRWGQRIGDFTVKDDLVVRNPYLDAPMAQYAGEVAVEWGEMREHQDEWGVRSHKCAFAAQGAGRFDEEIFPVEVQGKKQNIQFSKDEQVRADTSVEALAKMKTVYGSPTVTAGNASGISDGASTLLIMSEEEAEKRGLKPLAKIVDWISVCSEPRNSPVLPSIAMQQLLEKNKMSIDDMGLIEINEAFASMPLVSSRALANNDMGKVKEIRERLNVNGGAIGLGHPVGATGGRLTMTLIYELRRRKMKYGIASICGAIGQGDALIVETVL